MTRALALALALALAASPGFAQQSQMTDPPRDPASVPLPAGLTLELKLSPALVTARLGALFDRLAPDGALPVIGPGTTLAIRAAADRARVFLAYTQYDLNGDGAVSRAEFDTHAALTWGADLTAAEQQILDTDWTRADHNADGRITHSEILGLAVTLYPVPEAVPPGPDGTALLAMDLDNDGYVTWPEVEAVLAAPR